MHAIFQKMGKTRANVFTCDYCMQKTARIGSDWPGVGAVSILFTSHKNRYTSNVLVTKEGWALLRTVSMCAGQVAGQQAGGWTDTVIAKIGFAWKTFYFLNCFLVATQDSLTHLMIITAFLMILTWRSPRAS